MKKYPLQSKTMRLSLLLLLLVSLLLTACEEERPVDFQPAENAPDQQISSFTLRQTSDGELVWELVAELAKVWDNEHLTIASNPVVDFYQEERHTAILTADEGTVNMLSNDMEARGGVVVTSDEGAILRTEILSWDAREEKLFTDEPVSFEKDGTVIHGEGFESNSDLTDWKLANPSGIIAPEDMGGETF